VGSELKKNKEFLLYSSAYFLHRGTSVLTEEMFRDFEFFKVFLKAINNCKGKGVID
jgi:hypothetical protein